MKHIKYAAMIIYYLGFFMYFKGALPDVKKGIDKVAFLLLPLTTILIFLNYGSFGWMSVPLILCVITLVLRFVAKVNWLQALFESGACILLSYFLQSVLSVTSGLFRLVKYQGGYGLVLLNIMITLVLIVVVHKLFLKNNRIKIFLDSKRYVNKGLIIEACALVLLVLLKWWYLLADTDGDRLTKLVILVVVSLAALIILVSYTNISIQSLELIESRLNTCMLEEQYGRQIKHYESYQQNIKTFREFRHDYKAMMTSLKNLHNEKEDEMAVQLIENMNDIMLNETKAPVKYTDNVILDAMLQDLEELCKKNQIQYSFKVSNLENTSLSLLDSVRIYSNIINNALESCCKVPMEKRFIEITCIREGNWMTLQAVNSYHRDHLVREGDFLTSKQKGDHGLGLNIIKQIAEKTGGFVMNKVEPTKERFMIRVHIPNA